MNCVRISNWTARFSGNATCSCDVQLSFCAGVRFPDKKHYKDCHYIHFQTPFLSTDDFPYNADVPISIRWPVVSHCYTVATIQCPRWLTHQRTRSVSSDGVSAFTSTYLQGSKCHHRIRRNSALPSGDISMHARLVCQWQSQRSQWSSRAVGCCCHMSTRSSRLILQDVSVSSQLVLIGHRVGIIQFFAGYATHSVGYRGGNFESLFWIYVWIPVASRKRKRCSMLYG